MKLGDFRKATQHLEDECEIRIGQDLQNIFANGYTSRVVILHSGMFDAVPEEKEPPKVIIG